jgi:hypothetical protein
MQRYRHERHAPEDHIDAHEQPKCPCRAGKSSENDSGQGKVNHRPDEINIGGVVHLGRRGGRHR